MSDPTPAVAFLTDFCRPPWTLTAWRRERHIETKQCGTPQEVFGFLSKHRGSMIRFLLGYSRGWCPTKEPGVGDLMMATAVAVAAPTGKVGAIGERFPPSAWIEGRDHSVLVWRFLVPIDAAPARAMVEGFARGLADAHKCRVDALPLMIPLPIDYRFELVFHRKEHSIDLLTMQAPPARRAKPEDEDERFVRGDRASAAGGLPVMKKGWIPCDAITLLMGPPKQGKSLFVAKLASYITSGGSIEADGRWRPGWWDGESVVRQGTAIICEEEDPRLETLARLKAAGCNMDKVFVRMLVPDISIAAQLRQITKLAEDLGDCRMISFSPFSRALRIRSYTEDAVRDKIAPIQKWARGKYVCIIAIVHMDDGGRTSGSKAIPRVCRSGISFNEGVMTVALSNTARMGVKQPFWVNEASAVIDGAAIDTSRIAFR